MKTTIKWIAITCVVVLAFVAGRMWKQMIEFGNGLRYDVASDSVVRGRIEERLGDVPKEASRLYCARVGLPDARFFVAFTAPKSACDSLIREHFNINLQDMPLTNGVPVWIVEHGPNKTIPAEFNENWDISTNGQYQIMDRPEVTILYSPKASRMYICRQ